VTATRQRRGFAVAVALYMLTAIAGLAAASFFAVVGARRAATRATRQEEAASSADAGLRAVLDTWDVAQRDSIAVGGIDSGMSIPQAPDGTDARTFVMRITPSVYWIASAGRAAAATSVEATRTHSLLVEILRPRFPARAALVSRGHVVASGEVTFSGRDAPPPRWTDCPPPDGGAAPSIIVPDGVGATFDDSRPIPDVQVDSAAAAPSSYMSFGRVTSPGLADRATITLAPGAIVSPAPDIGRDCEPTDMLETSRSWGEPARTGSGGACERFYPVVNAVGDLTVTRGRGQGVLLVAGRLRIEGPFLFTGVIIAGGGIDATGPGVRIYGALASAGTKGVDWRGDGELRRSTCAVGRAANAAARAYPVPLRAWSELL
jgi:hypothetical protein